MNKEEQVFMMLDKVYDPELDQPLTELGFIDHINIKDEEVEVFFRLPTYWCSPNFAYIMAEDIRTFVSKIDWVKKVKVNLKDHCASEEINKGTSEGKRFSESFNGLSDGDLEELRRTFLIKGFFARQEELIKHLIRNGLSESEIMKLPLTELKELELSLEGDLLREKYLYKRDSLHHSTPLAFTTPEEKPLTIEGFKVYLQGAKFTRMNMEYNTHYCRGLLEVRYDLPSNNTAVPLKQ
ncbi:iron-sulfur cluster assembly protein [Peribacillus sp. SCS-155]|uniref:iron-sulfur cluster assembly protein n=1 Tax=Peribacillus sedimenti TaxID=3115297 RepID=UPI003906786E